MKVLSKLTPPFESVKGKIEGHGEGAEYEGKTFYYSRKGKYIPKDKVTFLTWEGNYAGRARGEKEYLLVCYNNENNLLFLKSIWTNPMAELKKYAGLTNQQVIEKIKKEQDEIKRIIDNYDKCIHCGETVILLEDNQPTDECLYCYNQHQK